MKRTLRSRAALISFAIFFTACLTAAGTPDTTAAATAGTPGTTGPAAQAGSQAGFGLPEETLLAHVRQLTFGGENAEAYLSFDGTRLIFQSTRDSLACDQIFTMKLDGSDVRRLSPGPGKTTCSYFLPGDSTYIYSSTHLEEPECPPRPDYSKGYVWPIHSSYEIHLAPVGGGPSTLLVGHEGYDAEATVSPMGDRIVFTSLRDGDLNLWTMKIDGSDLQRLTDDAGYDGGAFYSADGSMIVYRAHHPKESDALDDYESLLEEGLVRPSVMEIFLMNADGSGRRQLTNAASASFAPYFHPDGKRIIFSSNMADSGGRNFDLYLINVDGTGLRRVTFNGTFDGFPVFTADGKQLIFASNRNAAKRGETNIFIADWVEETPEITTAELKAHIRYLASDSLGGRRAGTPGNDSAADYIAAQFRAAGLQPGGQDGGWFQRFTFTAGTKMGPANAMSITGPDGRETPLQVEAGFRPLAFSADTTLTAPMVFAGYGITDTGAGYDDYAGIDVSGKAVVMFRYNPQRNDPHSPLGAKAGLREKVHAAKSRGAAAVIVVQGPLDSDEPSLVRFDADPEPAGAGIAVLTIGWDRLDSLIRQSGMAGQGGQAAQGMQATQDVKDLRTIQKLMNDSLRTASFALGSTAKITTNVLKTTSESRNVVGLLRGTDSSLTDEYVVLGAHFDHLGMGGRGSLAPDTVAVHHGADDNASGTAALLEAAGWLRSRDTLVGRNVLFVAFSAEELGLIGSAHFVGEPPVPLGSIAAMVNMDMVGRMSDSKLIIEGTGTSPGFEEMLGRLNADSAFALTLKPDGLGPSDQASFYGKDIPVLFFFTNLHSDYHKPSDTWEKINYEGEAQIVRYVSNVVEALAGSAERPAFVKVDSPRPGSGEMRPPRVSMGVVPDYAAEENGLKISGTRPGSPAEAGGLKGGDLIVSFGGKKVSNIYDFTYLLGEHNPGDVVTVEVMRGVEKVALVVTLAGSR